MKKVFLVAALFAMVAFVACKPKGTTDAEKAKQDSIENARIQDSIKNAEVKADTVKKDTVAVKEEKKEEVKK
jgi:hypothetical protein